MVSIEESKSGTARYDNFVKNIQLLFSNRLDKEIRSTLEGYLHSLNVYLPSDF